VFRHFFVIFVHFMPKSALALAFIVSIMACEVV
jgi:hypothetical protein